MPASTQPILPAGTQGLPTCVRVSRDRAVREFTFTGSYHVRTKPAQFPKMEFREVQNTRWRLLDRSLFVIWSWHLFRHPMRASTMWKRGSLRVIGSGERIFDMQAGVSLFVAVEDEENISIPSKRKSSSARRRRRVARNRTQILKGLPSLYSAARINSFQTINLIILMFSVYLIPSNTLMGQGRYPKQKRATI